MTACIQRQTAKEPMRLPLLVQTHAVVVAFVLSLFSGLLCYGQANAADTPAKQEAAVIIAVQPGAFVERNGTRLPLKLKDQIFVSDVIVTDATGKAQILFRDDTTVAVAPLSSISMDAFEFGGKKKAQFGMKMRQGLTRVITGRVVEENREGFHINTPHATVGIRGTILTTAVATEGTRVVVTQIGAGHSVSVTNAHSGQVSSIGQAGLTAIASPGGNEVRPSTPQEKAEAQSAGRVAQGSPASAETQAAAANESGNASGNESATGDQSASSSGAAEQSTPPRSDDNSANSSGSSTGGTASSAESSAPALSGTLGTVSGGTLAGPGAGSIAGSAGISSGSQAALDRVAEDIALAVKPKPTPPAEPDPAPPVDPDPAPPVDPDPTPPVDPDPAPPVDPDPAPPVDPDPAPPVDPDPTPPVDPDPAPPVDPDPAPPVDPDPAPPVDPDPTPPVDPDPTPPVDPDPTPPVDPDPTPPVDPDPTPPSDPDSDPDFPIDPGPIPPVDPPHGGGGTDIQATYSGALRGNQANSYQNWTGTFQFDVRLNGQQEGMVDNANMHIQGDGPGWLHASDGSGELTSKGAAGGFSFGVDNFDVEGTLDGNTALKNPSADMMGNISSDESRVLINGMHFKEDGKTVITGSGSGIKNP